MSIKEQIQRIVDSMEEQPDFIEELQYRLYVLEKIEKGTRQLDAGEGISHEQARAELAKWLTD